MQSLFALFILLILSITSSFSCEIIDDTGQKIHLVQPATRIISLAPDMTENLFAVGAGKQLVGVMRGSDYPKEAKKIPIVASYNSVDREAILTLRPDLIVAWSQSNFIPQLTKLGIPIYLSHQRKLTDIPATLQRLGCLTGTEEMATLAAKNFLQHLAALQKKYADKKRVSVFYQVWFNPLITVTRNSWINEIISLCGGQNIFANLKGVAPQINVEAVIMLDPEVIFGANTHNNWEKYWQPWARMQAVKNKNLFSLNPDLIERASPRLLDGAEEMCKKIARVRH